MRLWAVITTVLFAWFVWTMLELVAAVAVFLLQLGLFFALRPRSISGSWGQRRAYRRMAFYGGTEKQILLNLLNSRDPTITESDRQWAERLLIRRGYIVYIPPKAPRLAVVR